MATQGAQWAATPTQREAQLMSTIETMQAQIEELRGAINHRAHRPRQVLPEPDRFSGRAKDWDAWALAMRAKLRVDGQAIGDENAQFYYVYSSLDRNIQSTVLAFVQRAEKQGQWSPTLLLDHLERIFDDPNKSKKAGQRLREMTQGARPLPDYLPRFERTLFEAGADSWPDDAKITTLVGGLNKELKQRLTAQLNLPTTYNEFVRVLLALGDQDGVRFYHQGSNAMDWEQTKTTNARVAPAISATQRQRWRDEGKCVRCGSSSHWIQECKMQPTRTRGSSRSPPPGVSRVRFNDQLALVKAPNVGNMARRTGHVYEYSSDSGSDGEGC
ncbi:hypothetical protein HIM_08136 [Hirsutella minnesotensis 3608]|uniref:Retrotransposon gag domain-containing protein n=1 Tax=Hirsutella minnesotensis 3608 TaxID=1043627 RepID=A0A0F7ZYH2_9HYPO|nr:hypothetical protein HIM_11670 [Hirsutella minnesotensis 3608]KJZ69089.1 hypothetical protein HIM_11523 [Hirsutella minnesotensis 3608]KJZ70878.1 hypothetical protein HIM_09743 [Hirsutella minnesotensis 3608]KJZ72467.1 hypothetical protein HIM_08136 [Hirsutella minnesotensis 3608]